MSATPGGIADGARTAPRVSFVIVNWKNEDATIECVASVRAQDAGEVIEVIVVDNESTAESRAALAALEDATILVNERNEGFTGGMNRGFAEATGDFVAAINNDAVLEPSWLRHGLAELLDPGVGIVGGKEYLWTLSNPTRDEPGPKHTYVSVDARTGSTYLHDVEGSQSMRVASLNGSNLLIRGSLATRLRGFERYFFTYYEDADLCARALALGSQLVYSPKMAIWHRVGLSSSRRPFRREYLARRNQMLFVARHFDRRSWKRTILLDCREYVSAAILGSRSGFRGRKREGRTLSLVERLASGAAVCWAGVSWRRMVRNREQLGHRGERDDAYVARIVALALQIAEVHHSPGSAAESVSGD